MFKVNVSSMNTPQDEFTGSAYICTNPYINFGSIYGCRFHLNVLKDKLILKTNDFLQSRTIEIKYTNINPIKTLNYLGGQLIRITYDNNPWHCVVLNLKIENSQQLIENLKINGLKVYTKDDIIPDELKTYNFDPRLTGLHIFGLSFLTALPATLFALSILGPIFALFFGFGYLLISPFIYTFLYAKIIKKV